VHEGLQEWQQMGGALAGLAGAGVPGKLLRQHTGETFFKGEEVRAVQGRSRRASVDPTTGLSQSKSCASSYQINFPSAIANQV